jgi:hypothetical protein
MTTTPPASFVSAHGRAQLAQALLLSNAGAAVLSLIFLWVSGGPANLDAEAEEISTAELMQGLVALLQFFVYVVTAAAFLVWLHRAYKNLPAFGVRTAHSPGWAVGYWFIPFANLVRPYQTVKEMWIKGDPGMDFSERVAEPVTSPRPTTLVGVWWGFWLVSTIFDRFYGRFADRAETAEQVSSLVTLGVLSDLFTIIAAALAFLVVGTVDRMQTDKAAQLSLTAWPAPPPPPANFDNPPSPA